MSVLLLILGLVLFVALVVLHELGHALVARRKGVEVEEFGIGFPPRAWSKKLKNGTLFSLNWLPLGGFVKLKGEHDSATGKGTYGSVSLWAKTQILLAGVVVNWLTAVLIFTVLAITGLPQVAPNQFTVPNDTVRHVTIINGVGANSPAQKADIKEGDVLKSLAGEPITNSKRLSELTKANASKTVEIVVERNDKIQSKQITLNKEPIENQSYAGLSTLEIRNSSWSAPIVGVGVTAQFTWLTLEGLGKTIVQLFSQQFQQASQNVAGPVGIFAMLQQSSEAGFTPVLFLIGLVSLTLAIMNTLPIPALDGGRLFVTLIFRALRKPLTKEKEETIQAVGMLALLILVVVVTFVDVGRFFGK